MLSTGAFNALLKTLEEPPSYVIFILATTEVHKIPITVLSRCQRYDFKRITLATLTARLDELTKAEQIQVEEKALAYIARAADGSMRDALSLLDQCVAFHYGKLLTYENVLEVLGAVDTSVFSKLFRAISEGDTKSCIYQLEETVVQGRELGPVSYTHLYPYFVQIPEAGKFTFLDSGWMDQVSKSRFSGEMDDNKYAQIIDSIKRFERQLTDNGYIILKFFLNISEKEQEKRLNQLKANKDTKWRVSKNDLMQSKHYSKCQNIFSRYLTDKMCIRDRKKSLNCSGFNVVQNNGTAAGQTVFHFHVHVIPRYDNGPVMVALSLIHILERLDQCLERQKELYKEAQNSLEDLDGSGFLDKGKKLLKELKKIPGLVDNYEEKADELRRELEESRQYYIAESKDLTSSSRSMLEAEIGKYDSYIMEEGERSCLLYTSIISWWWK